MIKADYAKQKYRKAEDNKYKNLKKHSGYKEIDHTKNKNIPHYIKNSC